MFLLSGPSKHGWWHWYWHRWEQHSWFPPQQPSGNFSSSFLFIIFYWWIKVNYCFNTLWQFQAFRAMVQANPQILQVISLSVTPPHLFLVYMKARYCCFQPLLQELGRQNPQLVRMIQEHQTDFLRLINEPVEGGEGCSLSLSPLST